MVTTLVAPVGFQFKLPGSVVETRGQFSSSAEAVEVQLSLFMANVSAVPPPQGVSVFISYAHADETLRDRLEIHLALLKREGLIETWHDLMIDAGGEWEKKIDLFLNTCQIILLLISADFISSEYCWCKEMKRALERHEAGEVHVIPVILKPTDWKGGPFGKLE